jgi:adenylate cyclase
MQRSLNQYFRGMSENIQAHGGYVDKFIGDGLMALFGLETDRETAAIQAIGAVRAMSEALAKLNIDLANELSEPLRIGIGVHLGHVIVGEIGYGRAALLTTIGDTVNVASRLEFMTKEYKSEVVISRDPADAASVLTEGMLSAELLIRGRTQPLSALILHSGTDLPTSAK